MSGGDLLISRLNLLKEAGRILGGIHIRMMLFGQFSVGRAHLIHRGMLGQTQYSVAFRSRLILHPYRFPISV